MNEPGNDETCRGRAVGCTLDLTKRGDVALVNRAVVNDWPVSLEMRDAITGQLGDALEAAERQPPLQHGRLVVRLAWLTLRMEWRNMIADGVQKTAVGPYLRPRPRREKKRRIRHGACMDVSGSRFTREKTVPLER